MSRTLRFPAETVVGSVYLMAEGAQPEQLEAKGDIEVPAEAQAFLMLEQAIDLSFLAELAPTVLKGARLASLDPAALVELARQENLAMLAVTEPMTDEALVCLAEATALQSIDFTLEGPAGAGVAALGGLPLAALSLHGDPGETLKSLASSARLQQLHIHLDSLTADALAPLCGSALKSVSIEVKSATEHAAQPLLDVLTELASTLESITVSLEDDSSGLGLELVIVLVKQSPELKVNGVSYTSAAVARLERKLGA